MAPGCPETILELKIEFAGWGSVVKTKLDPHKNVIEKTVLAWYQPDVMDKIIELVERIEDGELYDTEKDEPMIADIPATEYKITKSSGEVLIIGKNEMGHLWMHRNYVAKRLVELIKSFSLLGNILYY